jgi:hypothetical protein
VPPRVRRPRECDNPGAIAELGLQVVEIERRVGMEVTVLTVNPTILGERHPRRHARVMVQGADEDLVARAEVAARARATARS